jgi:hypothetical protein
MHSILISFLLDHLLQTKDLLLLLLFDCCQRRTHATRIHINTIYPFQAPIYPPLPRVSKMEPASDPTIAHQSYLHQCSGLCHKQDGPLNNEPRDEVWSPPSVASFIYGSPASPGYVVPNGYVPAFNFNLDPQRYSCPGFGFPHGASRNPSFANNCRHLNQTISTPAADDRSHQQPLQTIYGVNSHANFSYPSTASKYSNSSRLSGPTAYSSRQNLTDIEEMSRPSTDSSIPSTNMKHTSPIIIEKKDSVSETASPTCPASPASPAAPGPPEQQHPTWSKTHDVCFINTVCMAQFLSLATLAQTVSPLLILQDYWDIKSPGQLAWFTAAYSMTLGTFILPSGKKAEHE